MLDLIANLILISALGGLLALLLEIAHRYLADYGECHVTINQEKDLVVTGGSSLLSTLAQEGIFIPSACGGRGTCAYCKIKVIEGGGPVLPTETPYLTSEEMTDLVRLSCQVKVRNDLAIEIPEEIFLIREFTAQVTGLKDLTPTIRKVELKIVAPEEGITFKPGQYVQLMIPKYKLTKGPEFRAYSIGSPGDEHRHVELIITKVPDGAVSVYVHDYLKEGQELTLQGPFGDFHLRDSDRDILLIATGSGLAPIRSILHQIEKEGIDRPVSLFFGARSKDELFFFDELTQMESKIKRFSFIPTLSRPAPEDGWQGEVGRVTRLIEERIPEKPNLDVYICGAPEMVESCLEALTAKGVPEDHIYFDKFA